MMSTASTKVLACARRWIAPLLLGVLPLVVLAQNLLPVPALGARVIDQTGSLSADQQAALEAKLAAFEQAKGSQIVMLMVPTTQPEDIASYANRIGNAWKIGRKDVGDGVLLVVAKNDRKVRIEVAKTLEGALPDLAAKQVIDTAITPAFKRGDFAGGLDAAADQLIARIKGEALPDPSPKSTRSASGFQFEDLAIFFLFAVPVGATVIRSIFGRKLGAVITAAGAGGIAMFITASLLIAGGAALVGLVIALMSNSNLGGRRDNNSWGTGGWGGGSGGWSGGSDGGGFSSGGGGDFGGGGASGDW
jgi:uncharacterized protein